MQGESQRCSGLCKTGARSFISSTLKSELSTGSLFTFFWIKPYAVLPEGKCWAAIPVFLPAVGMRKGGRAGASCRSKVLFNAPVLASFLTPPHTVSSEPTVPQSRRLAGTKLPRVLSGMWIPLFLWFSGQQLSAASYSPGIC